MTGPAAKPEAMLSRVGTLHKVGDPVIGMFDTYLPSCGVYNTILHPDDQPGSRTALKHKKDCGFCFPEG